MVIADGGLYDVLNNACLDLFAAGWLERARYERFTMPLYFHTMAETLAPLERTDSPMKGMFTVDRAETLEVPMLFLVEFNRAGDAATLADAYTGFLRAFSEPVARAELMGTDGDATLMDELYGRVHVQLRVELERYRFRYFVTARTYVFSRWHDTG